MLTWWEYLRRRRGRVNGWIMLAPSMVALYQRDVESHWRVFFTYCGMLGLKAMGSKAVRQLLAQRKNAKFQ